MKRSEILKNIKRHCEAEYAKVGNWVHGINHVQAVVRNGKRLAKMEGMREKDVFLVELACWLHDLGRVGENDGLLFLQSNHAEVSYQQSKVLLEPYVRTIGRESLYKVLQAIREHNLPLIKHPENRISQLLMDADRGAGLNARGIISNLAYLRIITCEPVSSIAQARALLPGVTQELVEKNAVATALAQILSIRAWYYGDTKQVLTGVAVSPLNTKAARKLYQKGIQEIDCYCNQLAEIIKQRPKQLKTL